MKMILLAGLAFGIFYLGALTRSSQSRQTQWPGQLLRRAPSAAVLVPNPGFRQLQEIQRQLEFQQMQQEQANQQILEALDVQEMEWDEWRRGLLP